MTGDSIYPIHVISINPYDSVVVGIKEPSKVGTYEHPTTLHVNQSQKLCGLSVTVKEISFLTATFKIQKYEDLRCRVFPD